MTRFCSKLVSFELSVTNTLALTNTLAYYGICKLCFCNDFIVKAQGPMLKKIWLIKISNFVISQSVCLWQAFPSQSNKHSSFARKFVNYGQKSFITLGPGVNVSAIKLYFPLSKQQQMNKLYRSLMASFFSVWE